MLCRAMEDFIRLGFIKVQRTPTEPDSILTIARRFGFVRDTNFGAFEDRIFKRPFSFRMAPRTRHPTRVSWSLKVAENC